MSFLTYRVVTECYLVILASNVQCSVSNKVLPVDLY